MTGPFASTGKQVSAACRLYMQKNGDTIAGRKIELIVKDDTGLAPETTKRIAQELVVQDQVTVLAGFGLTPLALAAAPVATEAKVPMIVMAAATQIIPTRSPFIVRTGFTLPQVTAPIGRLGGKEQDQARLHDGDRLRPRARRREDVPRPFKEAGGEIVESVRTPLRNPDYAPFLQRAKDASQMRCSCSCPRRRPRGDEAVRRAGPARRGHPHDRNRRRRSTTTCSRRWARRGRRDHLVPLLAAHESPRTARTSRP